MRLTPTTTFADRIIAWQAEYGRHDLPWQASRHPYGVWLSEIMLQQTQVATVRQYYARFLARFPSVADLAAADETEVMALWAGLGYYSRARNLHRAARMVMTQFGGQFPQTALELERLPGVGRSTAHAIAAFCFAQPVAIFDANVQRVLSRYWADGADLSRSAAKAALWQRANSLLPTHDLAQQMPAYTQGLMDLGATLCTPRRPQCTQCPLQQDCLAWAQGQPEAYPHRAAKIKPAPLALYFVQVQQGDASYLLRRPVPGIWAGLHCLPEISAASYQQLCQHPEAVALPVVRHILTHRILQLHIVCIDARISGLPELPTGQFYHPAQIRQLGLPKPFADRLQPA